MTTIVCYGSNSLIAKETLRQWGGASLDLVLLARDSDDFRQFSDEMRQSGHSVQTYIFDALAEAPAQKAQADKILASRKHIDYLFFCHGLFSAAEDDFSDGEKIARLMQINFQSIAQICGHYLARLKSQGRGRIAIISSVAGDRGKARNGIYGVTKSALTHYSNALRNHLFASGIGVSCVLPGLTESPMTAHVERSALMTTARVVGKAVAKNVRAGKDTIYAPWYWCIIMSMIYAIPEWLFKRLKL